MDDAFFVENTLIEINLPEDSNLDVETALNAPEPELEENARSLIPSVPQRDLLYFDETISIYVVIRVPREDEQALKSRIPRLNVHVAAQALNDPSATTPSPGKEGAPQHDVIWSERLRPAEEPIVVMEESADDDDVATALLIWKMSATLNRPRIRLTAPSVFWKVVGFLDPPLHTRPGEKGNYLQSGVPLPLNLLAPFGDEQDLQGRRPYLSASRLAGPSTNEPRSSQRPMPLKVLPKPAFRTLPALTSRIRFHRSHRVGELPTIAASLELDVPPSIPAEVDLLSLNLDLSRGQVEMMRPEHSVKLPRTCRPRESLVWLYVFTPLRTFDDPINNTLSSHVLEVTIQARVQASDICKPLTNIKWRTNVDFGSALKTIKKTLDPIIKPSQQGQPGTNSRTSVSTGGGGNGGNSSNPLPHPPTGSGGVGGGGNVMSPRSSLDGGALHGTENPEFTVSFLPHAQPVVVGEPFKWRVVVVNRTQRAVHLALTAIQKRRPQHGGKRHSHQSSTGSVTAVSKSGIVADAVVDDNLLYATVKAGGPEPAHLLCLSADVKVGPLTTGAAGEAELEFLPMAKGLLQPEAIRVTDMATSEFCDIRHMPDILAIEQEDGGLKEVVL